MVHLPSLIRRSICLIVIIAFTAWFTKAEMCSLMASYHTRLPENFSPSLTAGQPPYTRGREVNTVIERQKVRNISNSGRVFRSLLNPRRKDQTTCTRAGILSLAALLPALPRAKALGVLNTLSEPTNRNAS